MIEIPIKSLRSAYRNVWSRRITGEIAIEMEVPLVLGSLSAVKEV